MVKKRGAGMSDFSLTGAGRFVVGCNYWASHAGTGMWSDWRPEVVEGDLRLLAREGLQVLRVFPLWPDFQPLKVLRKYAGIAVEMRFGEEELPATAAGGAGVSDEMMGRFRFFADAAERAGLRLIVGLVTGWMSGRLFVPTALEGRNVHTDPVALMWQVRFVRYFVRTMKGHGAIAAWDLGNECNCMGRAGSREGAWAWTSAIANAIRVEDGSLPVVSGMHSLSPSPSGGDWTIQDQAELTDLLTTHPYPVFTPHCDQDPVNTIRAGLHATAESRMYADVGGKPCLAEEVGTLGPMIASEGVAAAYVRTALFSLWAHDCHGLLWWCAFDQDHLAHAPYDWNAVERELGLVRGDGTAKPALGEMRRFRAFLEGLPIGFLPPRRAEAVCILTEGQDSWAAAHASFILARQAGFDIEFQHASQPLRESGLYLLPGLGGHASFSRRFGRDLMERVRAGATLYASHGDALLSPFREWFGLEVETRERRVGAARIAFGGDGAGGVLTVSSPFRLNLSEAGAEVLAREADGNPAFTRFAVGKGEVFFLSAPVETHVATTSGVLHGAGAEAYWRIYEAIAGRHVGGRAVRKSHPMVGVTEHGLEGGRRCVVLVNYGPDAADAGVAMGKGWGVSEVWRGEKPEGGRCVVPGNDAAVFVVGRQGRGSVKR